MRLRIDKRYLMLPVSDHAQRKKLVFYDESGHPVYDLDVRLDPAGAQHMYYIDMNRFSGRRIKIECTPSVDFTPSLQNDIPATGGERFRPRAHFSAQRGWSNDPNGLVFYEGNWHLFFQHNPAGAQWGNMHWGHAVSRDLMHWGETDIALFPDDFGAMYSGCAVIDGENRTGFKQNGHDPLLLFYTAAGDKNLLSKGKQFTQCMACSTDGGHTFVKYEKNPVIEHIAGTNRDMKIVFCAELDTYIMALWLEKSTYALLKSKNLLKWEVFQKIELDDDNECPDVYPLSLDDERFWIFSGARDHYLIGKFTGGTFAPVLKNSERLSAAGQNSYAAQTFYGLPGGRRVRMSWNMSPAPGMIFGCSMTTPVDMYLYRDDSGNVRLSCRPVSEISALYTDKQRGRGTVSLPGEANDLRITLPSNAGSVAIRLMGLEIMIDTARGTVSSGGWSMRTERKNGMFALRIIQDVHSTEIYPEYGGQCMCIPHLADLSLNRVEAPEYVETVAYSLSFTKRRLSAPSDAKNT